MVTERDLQTRGLRFRIREAGEGPLVLCLHGFPDTARTWDDLLPRLADAGYHAVAPWMRGYPPTQIPANGDVSLLALGQDVLALADALGEERFRVVAHDWGAAAAYVAVALAPHRVERLAALAIPPPRMAKPGWRDLWALRHFLVFNIPWLAERRLRANGWKGLREICKRWSPSWEPSAADLAPVIESFEAPGGLSTALGYYRSLVRGARSDRGRRQRHLMGQRIAVPTLLLHGDEDVTAGSYAGDARSAFAQDVPFDVLRIRNAGHFVHREQPEETAAAVLRWMGAELPARTDTPR